MYRLLIVDDEVLFVNGLAEMLHDSFGPDLEIFRAYHAEEALHRLGRTKIDIVISDIRMPRMDGLELQQEIYRRWTKCRVIFLTGYDDFSYAQQAIRFGATEYMLKTDGDQAVMGAVQKAIQWLESESAEELFIAKARTHFHQAKASLQKDLILSLLDGDPANVNNLKKQFEDLEVPLNPDEPVLLVAGKIDEWPEAYLTADQALIRFAVHNISEELFKPAVTQVAINVDRNRIVWILQSDAWEEKPQSAVYVHHMLEIVQNRCRQLLKIKISFAAAASFTSWPDVCHAYENLQSMLNRSLGLEQEMLLIEHTGAASYETDADTKSANNHAHIRFMNKQIEQLRIHLDHNQRRAFFHAFAELTALPVNASSNDEGWVRLQIYLTLSSMFLGYLQEWRLQKEIGKEINLALLGRYDQIGSWTDATDFMHQIADKLFTFRYQGWHQQSMELVTRIHAYISSNISGDLSLTRLGETVSHNPVYLSRLYKQLTGKGLSDVIADARIQRAKDLLGQTNDKIHAIANAVGFESIKYFRQFFRKGTGLSPQEYRDAQR